VAVDKSALCFPMVGNWAGRRRVPRAMIVGGPHYE
jgi:hypothetical protein